MHFSQDSRLEPLDDTTKQIIGVLLDTKTELNLHTEQILDKQTESDLRAAERHDELVSLLRVAIANKGLPRGDVTDSVVVKARLEDNENAIPYSVWFESIRDREKAIQEAYTNTFKWVWCDPPGFTKPWSNFVFLFETGSGAYWITGKAGSRKSTMMKYINQSE